MVWSWVAPAWQAASQTVARARHAGITASRLLYSVHLHACCPAGQGPTAYSRFRFGSCKPGQGAATVSNPDDLLAGRVEANVIKVVDSGQHSAPAPVPIAAPSRDADKKKLAEGKKVGNPCCAGKSLARGMVPLHGTCADAHGTCANPATCCSNRVVQHSCQQYSLQ